MILRKKVNGNYSQISNHILKDKTLKLVDRGLLCTLLSLPECWRFTIKGLVTIVPDGEGAIKSSIKRLVEAGYLKVTQERSADGTYGANTLEILCDFVEPGKCAEHENTAVNPLSKKPTTVNPTAVNLTPEPNNKNINIKNNTYHTQSVNHAQTHTKQEPTDRLTEDTYTEVRDQIEYDALIHDRPEDIATIDLIVEIMAVTKALPANSTIPIAAGQPPKPARIVQHQYAQITMQTVLYALSALRKARKINNNYAYMRRLLYDATLVHTMSIRNQVETVDLRHQPSTGS